MYANVLTSIAFNYKYKGQPDRALENLLMAKNVEEGLGRNGTLSYATVLLNIGAVYGDMKQDDKALEYYALSRKVFDDLKLDGTRMYATLIMNTGTIYLRKNRSDEALGCFEKASRLFEKLGLLGSIEYANATLNTGPPMYSGSASARRVRNSTSPGLFAMSSGSPTISPTPIPFSRVRHEKLGNRREAGGLYRRASISSPGWVLTATRRMRPVPARSAWAGSGALRQEPGQ